MNKASGGDGIPVELFQILKDDAVKVLHSICQKIWKTQHADGECSLEIKRHLLLGRKVMTNLDIDSILKNRDITLPTKVRLVKELEVHGSHTVEAWLGEF